MRIRHWPATALISATGILLLAGCLAPGQAQKTGAARAAADGHHIAKTVADYATRAPLYGGSPRAWPTPAGTASDANYCDVALKLPLSREPAWQYSYTPVRFSSAEPGQIANYDGTLVMVSNCPQLLALDADSGRQLFNRDVYEHFDRDQLEQFYNIFFNPYGLLVAQDNAARQYCWDLKDGEPRRLWLAPTGAGFGAFVALADRLISSSDGAIRALDIGSGEELWRYPLLGERCGIVVSAGGVVVAWTSGDRRSNGEFYALDAASGELLWTYLSGKAGWPRGIWAVIDDAQECVYVASRDETVQRRDLRSGAVQWEYSWQELTSPEEREAIFSGQSYGPFPLYAIAPMVTPEGLVLCTISGMVIALDQAGQPRWISHSDVMLWGSVSFSNAVMVVERFVPPGYRDYLSPFKVFCPPTIDWGNYQRADEIEQQTSIFERFAVLDLDTGEALDYFETAQPTGSAAPAHNMFVLGETARFDAREHRILAYDWLDWQAEDNIKLEHGEDR